MLYSQLKGEVFDDEDVEQSQDIEAVEEDSDSDDEALEMWKYETDQYEKQKSTLAEAALKSRF